ncbi:hypothetical protein GCM10011504_12950 [Siccirubricoccus deserti]|nr:hypothetical protein GCM10011504_12950 [Siccirubricoccus deserti]
MRIACPACSAAYEVPDALVGQGRRLRCTRCGHAWMATPPANGKALLPAAPPPAAPAHFEPPPPVQMPRRAPQLIDPPLPQLGDTAARQESNPLLWAAWIGSALTVVAAVALLWAYRAEVVAVWPPAARLFLALGADLGG